MLEAVDVQIDYETAIEEALYMWKDSNADFADCLIRAKIRRLSLDRLNLHEKNLLITSLRALI